MRSNPPRHISDIAHLYLSRMRGPRAGPGRVVVAGLSADLMPGFHVANLALAAAARGLATRIDEASGLAVNAGCFLALAPPCWVASEPGRPMSVTAFARVTFALAGETGAALPRRPSTEPWVGLEMVHVPPWSMGRVHAEAVAREVARGGWTVVLYLAERDGESSPWRDAAAQSDVIRRVAFVTRAGRGSASSGCVGTFTRWTRALTDSIPVVVRDPGSLLARQYADAISNLLADASRVAHHEPSRTNQSPHALAELEPR